MVGVWQPLTLWYFNNKYSYSDILLFDTTNPTLPFLLIQKSNLVPYSDWYNKLLRYHIPLIQQATTWLYSYYYTASYYYVLYPYWYNTITFLKFYDTARYYVTTPMIQQFNLLLLSDWYNKLLCYYTTTDTTISQYYTPIDTTSNMLVNTPTLIQQPTTVLYLNWFSKLLCSYNDYIMLIYSYWYNNLIHYNNSIDTASYYVPILLLMQIYMPQPKQQTMIWYSEYQKYCMTIHD